MGEIMYREVPFVTINVVENINEKQTSSNVAINILEIESMKEMNKKLIIRMKSGKEWETENNFKLPSINDYYDNRCPS
jgi:hypothetical protein